MNDKELLTLAAKAYWGDEINDVCSIRWLDKDECIGYTHGDNQDYNGRDVELCWNPLEWDHDALRLAVKLRLRVLTPTSDTDVAIASCGDVRGTAHVHQYSEDEYTDPYAATRRAIVRAAAAIGKDMP